MSDVPDICLFYTLTSPVVMSNLPPFLAGHCMEGTVETHVRPITVLVAHLSQYYAYAK